MMKWVNGRHLPPLPVIEDSCAHPVTNLDGAKNVSFSHLTAMSDCRSR